MPLTLSVRSFHDAGDVAHLGLAAELPFRAHLAGDAGDLGGEAVELVDHRVDGVLQLEDLAPDVDGDLLGEVAVGDGGGDLGDVAHLAGEVAGHAVDAVGQVLPDAGHALDLGLAAQPPLRAHLAGDAGHLARRSS